MQHLPLLLCLLATLAAGMPLAAEDPRCKPEPELAARLEALDSNRGDCQRTEPCWAERERELRALTARYPGDVTLWRALQAYEQVAVHGDDAATQALYERYDARIAANPADPGALYLRARLSPFESKTLIDRSIELDPTFPWSRFARASMLFRDPARHAQAKADLAVLLEACPSRVDLWAQFVAQLEGDAARDLLVRARTALPGLPGERRLQLLMDIWDAEGRLAGTDPAAVTVLRERLRGELAELEKLEMKSSPRWWRALEEGYQIVGGDLDALARRKAEAMPCDYGVLERAIQKLPKPDAADPGPGLEAAEALARRCPDDFWVRLALFERQVPATKVVENAALVASADAALQAWPATRKNIPGYAPLDLGIAEGLLSRGLEPERARTIALASLEALEAERVKTLASLAGERLENARRSLRGGEARIRLALAEVAWLEREQRADARQEARLALDAAKELLAGLGSSPNLEILLRRSQILQARFGGAQAGAGDATAAESAPAPGAVRKHWREVDQALPEFEHRGIDGRTWTLAEVRGKTWLVNVWATWCAPCLGELPEIQNLAKKLAGRRDIGVLTVNVDSQSAKVAPFMQRYGYDFPVLVAGEWLNLTAQGIPQNWLVDRQGTIRARAEGFLPTEAPAFSAETLRELEKLAAAPPR